MKRLTSCVDIYIYNMELSFLTCLSVLADVLAHIYIIYVSCSAGSKHDVLYKRAACMTIFGAHNTPPPYILYIIYYIFIYYILIYYILYTI